MPNLIRMWMKLCEAEQSEFSFLKDFDNIRKPFELEPKEDIDYAGNWREILEYPDPDSSVSEEEQIQRALDASGATEVTLPNGEVIYVTDDEVIELDKNYASIKEKNEWISGVDVDTYYPNHEQEWNDEFWKHPSTLYHATTEDNVQDILKHGLETRNQTRGIANRGVGHAVFTTSDVEDLRNGSYGDFIFEIDTGAMAQFSDCPFVSREPPIVEAELRETLAWKIGMRDYYYDDVESDISPDTIIIHGSIAPQYLELEE